MKSQGKYRASMRCCQYIHFVMLTFSTPLVRLFYLSDLSRIQSAQITSLQGENKQLRETLAELVSKSKSELKKSNDRVASMQSEAEEMTSAMQKLRKQVNRLNAQLHESVTSFKETEERLLEMNDDAKDRISTLQLENMKLRETLAEVEQQSQFECSSSQEECVINLQTQVDDLTVSIEALKSENDVRSSQLFDSQKDLSEKSMRLEEAERELEKLKMTSNEELDSLRDDNTKLNENLFATEQRYQSELDASQKQIEDLKVHIDELTGKVQALESSIDHNASELSEYRALLAEKEKQIEDRQTAFLSVEQENMKLKESHVEAIKKTENDLQVSLERLAGTEIQTNEMKQTIQALESEVEERSAQLLESQALLSEKAKQLEEAEATFTKEVEEIHSLRQQNEELKDLLTKSKHHAQIDMLEWNGRITELHGEVDLMARTIQTLRSEAEKSSSQLLQYQAMLADKTLQLEEAESALKTVRNNNSQLHESFAEAMEKSKNEQKESNEKIADLNTQVEMMTKTVQELQTSIDVRSSELHDSEVSLAKKSRQLQETVTLHNESKSQLEDTSKRLQDAEENLAASNAEKAHLMESLEEVEKKLESSQAQVTDLKTQVDQLSSTVESLQAEVDSKSSALRESEANLAETHKEHKEKEAELNDNFDKLSHVTKELEEANAAFEKLQKETDRLNEAFADLEERSDSDMEASRERITNLQSQVDEMSNTISSLQSEAKDRSQKLLDTTASLESKSRSLEDIQARLSESQVSLAEKSKLLNETIARSAMFEQENNRLKELVSDSQKRTAAELKVSQVRVIDLENQVREATRSREMCQLDIDGRSFKLSEFEASLAEKSKQLEKAAFTIRSLCKENMRLKASQEVTEKQSQDQYSKTQEQIKNLQKKADDMERMIQSLEDEVKEKSSKLLSNQISLDEMSKKLEDAEERYAALHYEGTRREESFAEVERQSRRYMATSQERVARLQKECNEMTKAMKSLQCEYDGRSSQLVEHKVALTEKSMQLMETEAKLTKVEEEATKLRETLAKIETDSKGSHERIAKLEIQCDEASALVQTLRSRIDDQEIQFAQANNLLSEKSTQLRDTEAKLSFLHQENMKLFEFKILPEDRALVPVATENGVDDSLSSQHEPAAFLFPSSRVVEWKDSEDTQLKTAYKEGSNVHGQADEMTRSIQALRSQIEERTTRLLERKKIARKSKQVQRSPHKQRDDSRIGVDEWKRRSNEAHSASVLRGELLNTLQKDMENALVASKETIHRLKQEVSQWQTVATDAENAYENCQREYEETKQKLGEVTSSLDDALIREEDLKRRISDLEEVRTDLEAKLSNEKQLKEEALAAVEQKLQALRQEYEAVIDDIQNFTTQEQNEAAEEIRRLVEMHDSLVGDAAENDRFNNALAEYKRFADSTDNRRNSSDTDANLEMVPSNDEMELFRSRTFSSDMDSSNVSQQLMEMSDLNTRLLDTIEGMRGEIGELQEENDSLQCQLKAKYDLFSKVQRQFEALHKEYNAVLAENKGLRKENSNISSLQKCVVSAITGSTEALTTSKTYAPLARPRQEYDLKIESLTKEKRELLLQSTSAVAGMQRAEEEVWKTKEEITKLKKQLRVATMAKSALQLTLDTKENQIKNKPDADIVRCDLSKENDPDTGDLLVSQELVDTKQLIGILRNVSPPQDNTDNDKRNDSGLLVDDKSIRPKSEAKTVTFAKTCSTEDTSIEGLHEVECAMTPTELGAKLLINDGSQSSSEEVNASISEDESIVEVECTLETTDLGSAVMVNDKPAPSSPVMLVGLGVPSFPMNMVSPDMRSCPTEISMMGNASEVEFSLNVTAMVAKILRNHEVRQLHEPSSPRTRFRPIMSSSSSYDTSESPPRVSVWDGYESE